MDEISKTGEGSKESQRKSGGTGAIPEIGDAEQGGRPQMADKLPCQRAYHRTIEGDAEKAQKCNTSRHRIGSGGRPRKLLKPTKQEQGAFKVQRGCSRNQRRGRSALNHYLLHFAGVSRVAQLMLIPPPKPLLCWDYCLEADQPERSNLTAPIALSSSQIFFDRISGVKLAKRESLILRSRGETRSEPESGQITQNRSPCLKGLRASPRSEKQSIC